MKRVFLVALAGAAADLISKRMLSGRDRVLIPGVIRLTTAGNSGIAMGFFRQAPVWALLLTGIILIGGLVFAACRIMKSRMERTAAGLILGGAAGNLLDRLIHGSVTDLFELLFIRFYIFNLADVLICTGAFWMLVSFIVSERKENRTNGQRTNHDPR